MATLTDLNTRIDSAVAALDAGDFTTALRHARAARLMLISFPDSEADGEKLTFDREQMAAAIADLISSANTAAANAIGGPWISQDIEYGRG